MPKMGKWETDSELFASLTVDKVDTSYGCRHAAAGWTGKDASMAAGVCDCVKDWDLKCSWWFCRNIGGFW